MWRSRSFAYGLLFALLARVASADIYYFVDPAGVAHYTNVPVDPRYTFLLATPGDRTESGEAYSAEMLARSSRYDPIIEEAAASSSVAPDLLRAVIVIESGFNAGAVSRKGAVGLMQLMPEIASRYGVSDRFDPRQNVRAGARHLRSLIDRYDEDLKLVLAAYNAGEGAVERYGRRVPPYKETRTYVPKVLRVYQALLNQAPG
jgi:soluble lytic murein transglycosylase-like protein